jgi:hypothetical protein
LSLYRLFLLIVAEIDKVVQGNAANAEESASAAQQMKAQKEGVFLPR